MYAVKIYKLSKTYEKKRFMGSASVKKVLDNLSLEIEEKEFVCIMGDSGCGKTTLLKIIGTIDRPTSGKVELFGFGTKNMNNGDISRLRRQRIGFVFQDFRLLNSLSVKENIIMPSILDGGKYDVNIFKERIDYLGIGELLDKYPYELSGGEKQRAAIMRAMMNNPDLILADEPTGNLDSSSASKVMEILQDLNIKYGKTVVLVSHDANIAKMCNRIIKIKNGTIESDL